MNSLGTCGLRAEVAGGASIRFTGNDDAACAAQHSFDTGLDLMFLGTNAKGSVEVMVDDVTEGVTGSDFPTRLLVTSAAREHWQGGGCLVTIGEHRLVRTEASALGELRHYQVSGHGTCSDSIASMPAGAPAVTVGEFNFRSGVTWRD
jgi:hypothetical protein